MWREIEGMNVIVPVSGGECAGFSAAFIHRK
jgi:hypothetical protein